MIQKFSKLKVADNSGAKLLGVIHVGSGFQPHYARLGDIITASVKEAAPHAGVKKGEVVKAVIVRQRKEYRRSNGTYIRFDENAAVLVDDKKEPRGTRIFGPIAREIKQRGFNKIASLAPEVL
ncbi:MAG: 50S ribosomal protein L14 [Candidatus Kerfeldbacteria bacterium RIFCSPHIGHO2_12_FULL_48_17]|uniref:Large ribosomal subunit protein uL14 n=1 Tax=Candidatus Kerfeldbacteria bacterium RIFCSPHIGHO2_12_FULL_48_17 TaxID=1798542 RepID=A0A1G2B7P8_9BACT|nr:MAG: 50S ribosomal protein L14 [Candidatus Kerfeldbacteria bacterium RIFCSPHIGHO2_12_FULL_48_17]